MKDKIIDSEQGHWILAKMGKKVLRPGGKELTLKLVEGLDISNEDAVIEFAPGMGYTAEVQKLCFIKILKLTREWNLTKKQRIV